MSDESGLPPLREVIARHGLDARKSLGQHFLLDLNLTRRIARAAGDLSKGTVIEVGPGPGGLTRALLLEGATRVIAIERDRRCLAVLDELAAAFPGRLEVVEGDALAVDMATFGDAPRKVVSNLPYNISTPLVVGWLRAISAYDRLTLMFQKEVAERLAAGPGTKAYGRLSVMTGWLCEVRFEFNVAARAFTPPPKVESAVISLIPRPRPLAPASFEAMERVVAAAFNQRRKMLRAALRPLCGADAERVLGEAGIDPTLRAESLSVEQFAALARAIG